VIFQDGLGCLLPHSDPRTSSGKIYQALEEGLTIYVSPSMNPHARDLFEVC
jgi:murein tripeptide amidase MpaA